MANKTNGSSVPSTTNYSAYPDPSASIPVYYQYATVPAPMMQAPMNQPYIIQVQQPDYIPPNAKGFSFTEGCCYKTVHNVEVTDTFVHLSKKQNDCAGSHRSSSTVYLKDITSIDITTQKKSMLIAYILWFFFGWLGAHRFYLGKWKTGLLWLFTGAVFGFAWFVDPFFIPSWVNKTYFSLSVHGHHNQQLDVLIDPASAPALEQIVVEAKHKLV